MIHRFRVSQVKNISNEMFQNFNITKTANLPIKIKVDIRDTKIHLTNLISYKRLGNREIHNLETLCNLYAYPKISPTISRS